MEDLRAFEGVEREREPRGPDEDGAWITRRFTFCVYRFGNAETGPEKRRKQKRHEKARRQQPRPRRRRLRRRTTGTPQMASLFVADVLKSWRGWWFWVHCGL